MPNIPKKRKIINIEGIIDDKMDIDEKKDDDMDIEKGRTD